MADAGKTAIVEALLDDERADEEERQFGLFAPPATEAGARKAELRGWSGIGRKPGAKNKRTEATIAFILSRHRDPRIVLAEMAEANVFDLAALLGCTPFEAQQEKRLAAIGLLPYVAARMTPEAPVNFKGIFLTINGGGGDAQLDGIGAAVTVLDHLEFVPIEGADLAAANTTSCVEPPETGDAAPHAEAK